MDLHSGSDLCAIICSSITELLCRCSIKLDSNYLHLFFFLSMKKMELLMLSAVGADLVELAGLLSWLACETS